MQRLVAAHELIQRKVVMLIHILCPRHSPLESVQQKMARVVAKNVPRHLPRAKGRMEMVHRKMLK